MSRRKLRLRTDDLKELRVKLVAIWCTSRNHMAKAKLSKIRITTSQSKLLPLRRRRRRRIRRVRVASCADLLIIGQRSVQITKEEDLNLSRRL
jgi:CelD/BcsL family acetyltransferase involved in cellulose biosynthesis